MNDQQPLPLGLAARSVARCVASTVRLLLWRETHLPKEHVGRRLRFADGTSARVFRETVVDRDAPSEPCILVVEFRLRLLRGRWHALFLWECILNTPMFVGFPGFMSKLWLAHDEKESYRGLYEWNGAAEAEHYARALWRILELVCARDSIHYVVIPGFRRDDVLRQPQQLNDVSPEDSAAWWRLVDSV
jgi:hypothetical protein